MSYMLQVFMLWLALIITLNQLVYSLVLLPLTSCSSSADNLYLSDTEMTQNATTTFQKSFLTSFSAQPDFVFGATGYMSSDGLLNELYMLSSTHDTVGYTIQAALGDKTRIKYLTIHYLAILDEQGLFVSGEHPFTSFANVSTSSNTLRTDNIAVEVASSLSADSSVAIFMTGLRLRSSGTFTLMITGNLLNSTHIETGWLEKAQVSYLIIDPLLLTQAPVVLSTNTLDLGAEDTISVAVEGSYSASFMAGLVGATSTSTGSSFHYSLTTIATNTIEITNSGSNVELSFAYLILAEVDCVDLYWSLEQQLCIANCGQGKTSSPSNGVCQTCSSSCSKCSTSSSYCTQCKGNFKLLKEPGLCVRKKFDLRLLLPLFGLPFIIFGAICYIRRVRRKRLIKNQNMQEHPSIQF